MTLVLALVVAVLFGCGTYLILQRNLTRVIIGLTVMGHAANLLLLLAGGPAGQPPLVSEASADRLAIQAGAGGLVDPLPQALALTAIVIAFGVGAFLLTLAYRSWVLRRTDEVEDDLEDRRIARLGEGGPGRAAGGRGSDRGSGERSLSKRNRMRRREGAS